MIQVSVQFTHDWTQPSTVHAHTISNRNRIIRFCRRRVARVQFLCVTSKKESGNM